MATGVNMDLHLVADAEAEDRTLLPAGTVVQYVAHVSGGMVRVRFDGRLLVIHPHATKELRP